MQFLHFFLISALKTSIVETHYKRYYHGNISVQKLPQIATLHIVKMGEIWGRNQNDKNGLFSIFLHKIICFGCVLELGDSNTHPKHMILWRTNDN